jgi:hypothetical protein
VLSFPNPDFGYCEVVHPLNRFDMLSEKAGSRVGVQQIVVQPEPDAD